MMRAPSTQWFEDIAKTRETPWVSETGPSYPTLPWIQPELHPRLRSLIERWGMRREVAPRESILGENIDRVDKLVLVESGVTARCVSSPYAQSRVSIAVSLPGRLACGNLNFFTRRPCIGRYFALVPSVVLSVSQDLVMDLAVKDMEFMRIIATQFELACLSDRMGFAVESLLDVDDRIIAFYLAWSAVYGRLVSIGGDTWVDMPMPLRGEAIRAVVNCSSTALERYTSALKRTGGLVIENDRVRIKVDLLKPLHEWMCNAEEKSRLPRPEMIDFLFEGS